MVDELGGESRRSIMGHDSCAVLRGSKNGLITLIQKEAPVLLEIDGDTSHHGHNAAKQFCSLFRNQVERFLSDLHTEFKWCTDLKSKSLDICDVLNIEANSPERYMHNQ